MPTFSAPRTAVALVSSLLAPLVLAAGVSVKLDTATPAGAPFPSNRYTVFDPTQNSLRRINLPKPDCTVYVTECQDIDVINTLDGFSTQPRITVPFSGDIDPHTVTSETVFLFCLGQTISHAGFGERVGINQVLWDPETKTLVFESDQLLREHARYVLVVTDGVKDTQGQPLKPGAWADASGLPIGRAGLNEGYRSELRDGLRAASVRTRLRPVAASVFTTQSATTELVKIGRQIKASRPAAVDFMIGSAGGNAVRALFDVSALAGIQFNRQTGSAPSFTQSNLPLPALGVVPGAVAKLAYGRFTSPNYQTPERYIPATHTLTGAPQPQGTNELVVQVFIPAGSRPAAGWPVAVFGHGFTDSLYGAPWTVASVLASRGIATLSINVVGHGGGALGTLNVLPSSGEPVSVPAGGRGIDQDGNGTIDSTEGVSAVGAVGIISSRDGLRQTVADVMQLVRQLEAGVDVDGDGSVDFDAQRIYYAGQSFGGIYGTMALGVEPGFKAGVPNVPGGSITEVARLGAFRVLTAIALATRVPPLLNLPPLPGVPPPANLQFNENMPLRNLPPVVNTVPGALPIQQVLDRYEWVQQAGNPVSYAALIRKEPLRGSAPKPVIVQFAKGDMTVPNPTTSAILRAGELADRATYYRNDLSYAGNPGVGKDPHVFLTNIGNAAAAGYAIGAQTQIADFFASGGATVIDPDGSGPYFEVPIAGPLPEGLNYLP